MCPETRGLFGADVVQQVDQSTVVDDQVSAVAAVEEIRIVFIGNLQTQGFIQVAGQEFEFELDAEFFFDQLVDLVVFIRLITGIAAEHSQRDRFESAVCQSGRKQGCDHCERKKSSQKFLHTKTSYCSDVLTFPEYIIDSCTRWFDYNQINPERKGLFYSFHVLFLPNLAVYPKLIIFWLTSIIYPEVFRPFAGSRARKCMKKCRHGGSGLQKKIQFRKTMAS